MDYQKSKYSEDTDIDEVNGINQTCKFVFWVASTDATHIFVWNWGSKMAAFPVMVPDFFVL